LGFLQGGIKAEMLCQDAGNGLFQFVRCFPADEVDGVTFSLTSEDFKNAVIAGAVATAAEPRGKL
jgi:hypothetical protein